MSGIARYETFTTAEISSGKIEEVVALHAGDAPFVWAQRDAAVRAPHFKIKDLAKLDERVEAHIDGLRVGGDTGWEIVKTALEEGKPGMVFAAAVLAFEGGEAAKVQVVLDVGTATPATARALVSALGWLDAEVASPHIRALLNASEPVLRRVGIAAAAAHRLYPRADILQAAFASDDPLLKARTFRAVGELGLVGLQQTVRANLRSEDPLCRFWAGWSTTLLTEHEAAVACLQNIAEGGGPFSERAAQMAMRRLAPNDAKAWLKKLVKDLGQKRIAVIAAGAFADPEVVPFLIDQMKVPKLARVAGESFSLISGADIAYEDLDGEPPEDVEVAPPETPEAEAALEADL